MGQLLLQQSLNKTIMEYSETAVDKILLAVQSEFDGAEIEDIPQIIKQRRKTDFDLFIDKP